ncbi:unnamed protein product, partial [Mesorhabditis spiculigera]
MARICAVMAATSLFIICTAAHPYLVLPRSPSKRAFDRIDDFHDFGLKKRAFDRLDGSYDFGMNLRKRAFDRLDGGYDFGLGVKKRAFDRLDDGDFFDRRRRAFYSIDELRPKRAFDRLDGFGFGLDKRSGNQNVPSVDVALLRELEDAIRSLQQTRANEAALRSIARSSNQQLVLLEPEA